MFDTRLIPSRDPLQTDVYNEYKPQGTYLQDWAAIPHRPVDALTSVFADMTYTSSEWKGDWTWGAEIPTLFEDIGGNKTFSVSMWARGLSINADKLNELMPAKMAQIVKNDATQALKRTMQTLIERKYIALLTTPANYSGTLGQPNAFVSTPTIKWDAAANSTVQADIIAVLQKMSKLGLPVTHIIIPQIVMDALTLNSTLMTALHDAAVPEFIVTKEVLQKFTGILPSMMFHPQAFSYGRPRAIDMSVAGAAMAQQNQIWTDDVTFLHIEDAGMGTYPSLVALDYLVPVVQQLPYNPETLDTKFIARQSTTPVLFNKDAAYLLHDVLT
jgi:hypothetical protein